jgi:hypothetical protein
MDPMQFYLTDHDNIEQSAFFPVSKSELIEYFRKRKDGFEPFERIEKHHRFQFHFLEDPNTIFQLFPVGDEDYLLQMTITDSNLPPFPEHLAKLFDGKEPIEPKSKEAYRRGPGYED